jgi:hypothetical protein
MMADGHRGRWLPEAKVQHYIPPERLTIEYLDGFFYGLGQTDYLMKVGKDPSLNPTTRQRRKLWRRAMRGEVRSRVLRWSPLRTEGSWLVSRLRAAKDWGYLAASRQGSGQQSTSKKAA